MTWVPEWRGLLKTITMQGFSRHKWVEHQEMVGESQWRKEGIITCPLIVKEQEYARNIRSLI